MYIRTCEGLCMGYFFTDILVAERYSIKITINMHFCVRVCAYVCTYMSLNRGCISGPWLHGMSRMHMYWSFRGKGGAYMYIYVS